MPQKLELVMPQSQSLTWCPLLQSLATLLQHLAAAVPSEGRLFHLQKWACWPMQPGVLLLVALVSSPLRPHQGCSLGL